MAQVHLVKMVDEVGEVHEHLLVPGEECPACTRKLPKEASDDPTRPKRDRITLTVPLGQEGVLEDLWMQVVEKHGAAWPEDLKAARDSVFLIQVGERSWMWNVAHFCAYMAATLDVVPNEEGG